LLATRAIHVIATTILLNLNIAERAKLDKLKVLVRPFLKLEIVLFLSLSSLLIKIAHAKLSLTAVGIDAKAILLSKIPALKRAGIKLAFDLKLGQGLVKGKAIELIPSDFIDKLLDLLVINDFSA